MDIFPDDGDDWRAAGRDEADDVDEVSLGDELERLRALRGMLSMDAIINAQGDAHVGTPATDTEAFMQVARQQQLARLLEAEQLRMRSGSNSSLSNTETTRSIASTAAHDTRAHSPAPASTSSMANSVHVESWEVHVAPRLAVAHDHHVYDITLGGDGTHKHVGSGRYSELRRIHDHMQERHAGDSVVFPRKKLLGNRGAAFVQGRAADLREYFVHVCRTAALVQFWLQQTPFQHRDMDVDAAPL